MCACGWLKINWSESHILPKPHWNVLLLRVWRPVLTVPTFILSVKHKSGRSGRTADVLRVGQNTMQCLDSWRVFSWTDGFLTIFPLFTCHHRSSRSRALQRVPCGFLSDRPCLDSRLEVHCFTFWIWLQSSLCGGVGQAIIQLLFIHFLTSS